ATREMLGSGTLFANAEMLLGNWAKVIELVLIPDYKGFLLIILPPGGFLMLGFLMAGKRLLDRRLAERQAKAAANGSELSLESTS
ncbi:MAG: electron transport complex subunit RsxE, partial [Candidatus Thiodiazotropha sp.]